MTFDVKNDKTCTGCIEPIIAKAFLDECPTNIIVSLATGCLEVSSTKKSNSAWNVPVIHSAFGNAAATISGIESAYNVLKRKKQLDEDVKFLVIGGDGGTYDIGLQALSGALERGHNFVYVCLDNGAYMNTGGQRSSSTPYGSSTTTTPGGNVTFRKDIMKIIEGHNIPYVAQASIADMDDLKKKARKAFETKGPAFINVISPCISFWKFQMKDLRKVNVLAVDTCFWPIYEIENGEMSLHIPKDKLPVEEFLKIQKRFSNLSKEQIKEIQNKIDSDWKKLLKKNK
ncbi:pyruvate ferredoxin oxidoreductase [Candidatus Woesearchaeota archaeon]|nr:pyruvate ferredoxin oxidoreductase [Candidatus Woesearchaeota archaeon]